MSLLAAPVVSLLFFSAFAGAAISSPDCSTSWEWSFNSLGQNACTVAAYMMSTCDGGSFTVNPLQPGSMYGGPSDVGNSNFCICSTIGYSLISACAGCQGENWISWSQYVTNCTDTLPPSSFPNPIPSGTRVPQWALLDVTNENFWDFNKSYATGDSPEIGPGTVLGASGSSVSVSASTTGSSNTGTSLPVREHSSNAGAIAGGVIAGIAAISILVAALLFYLRRRRSLEPIVVFEGDGARHMDQVQLPMSDQWTVVETLPETMAPPKPYNPDDPTTYPEYQVVQPPPAYISDQIPSISPRSLYTVATPPNPQTQRYRGLPIV
ncbi:hypothetical protein BGY98DRAFT_268172 [Russula aff. rugulosa BPL654]|nr:hypothetical protein BGY98DRAFT_268172 [Russula aff. rugulosa BPL654]